jgi:hypothetical protein
MVYDYPHTDTNPMVFRMIGIQNLDWKLLSKLSTGAAQRRIAMLRNHIWVFIKCLIENPAFDSQTKDHCAAPSCLVMWVVYIPLTISG